MGTYPAEEVQEEMLRNFALNATLLILSTIVAGGIGELYFRFFDPQAIIPRYVEAGPYGIRKNIGDVNGEMIVPEYRHRFTTNSQGFRGSKEYTLQKPTGIFRIITLGDSVTLGHGVADDETFSAVLERTLGEAIPTEVINMGVSGFGTAEELLQLRHVALQYQPDLVVLAYFPNDPYNNMVSKLYAAADGKLYRLEQAFVPAIFIRDHLYSIPGYSFLCQHSHVVNFIRNRASGFFINRLAQENQISSQTSKNMTAAEAELTTLLLQELMADLKQHRIPLIVMNIPLIREGEMIENLPLENLKFESPNSYLFDVGGKIYEGLSFSALSYEKDSHPRPHAHRLIGEKLSELIKRDVLRSSVTQSADASH